MSSDDLQQENAALHARIRELAQLIEEQKQVGVEQAARLEKAVADLQEQTRVLNATLNSITDGVMVCDMTGRVTHLNPAALHISSSGPEHVEVEKEGWSTQPGMFRGDGVTPLPPEEVPLLRALGGEKVEGVEIYLRPASRPDGVIIMASASPIRADDGTALGAVAVFHDITERKRWEAREHERQRNAEREKNEMLQHLQLAVRELSTPVLEVWDDVLVLPVIGVVDSQRSAEMMERLLEAVEQKQCRYVIIDITGVEVIDSATAHQFIKLVTAVEYLGAECVLTGTRGAVAQTMVSLGMDLGPLTMLRTLKHGLRESMRRMNSDAPRRDARARRL